MSTSLDLLLWCAAAGVPLSLLLGRHTAGRWLLVVLYAIEFLVLLGITPGTTQASSSLQLVLLGNPVGWQLSAFGYFFAFITIAVAGFVAAYAAGEWGETNSKHGIRMGYLYASLQLNVLAMLLLLSSADLLSLFIGWELTSWAGLLLMLPGGSESVRAAQRYLVYAVAGGMAIFAALLLTDAAIGSLQFAAVIHSAPHLGNGTLWTLVLLYIIGFSVKMGILPFHLWQPPAYAFSVGPASAFLSAISARVGLFAIGVVVLKLIGVPQLDKLTLLGHWFGLHELLLWVAALTAILPTYVAMRQMDARLLLAWHGVGQGGFMFLGLLMTDQLGSAGGLLHVFNYAGYQTILVMAVFAVIHRTGTADLDRLGGLVARMPLSFLAMLIGIIGLAGLPPMSGFVSKWMIYRDLITTGHPLLFVAAVISTLGTILSVYKLIHNVFLGQLRLEHVEVKEAPWSMTLPMLLLGSVVLLTGIMPGLVLGMVAKAQVAIGIEPVHFVLGGIESPAGSLNMLWVCGVLFTGFGVGALVFYGFGNRSRRVHQLDNYAGGHFLTADTRYQYSDNFYAGLMHRIQPWYRNTFTWLEESLVSVVGSAAILARGFFTRANPTAWAVFGSTLLLLWVMWHALD